MHMTSILHSYRLNHTMKEIGRVNAAPTLSGATFSSLSNVDIYKRRPRRLLYRQLTCPCGCVPLLARHRIRYGNGPHRKIFRSWAPQMLLHYNADCDCAQSSANWKSMACGLPNVQLELTAEEEKTPVAAIETAIVTADGRSIQTARVADPQG